LLTSTYWFLLAVAGFLYFQLFLPNGTPIFMPDDHWIFMQQARDMLQGKVLYRDIFQYTFPGAEFVYAALLKIFGAKVWIPNAALIALGVGLAWLTTAVARRVLTVMSALLPASLLLSLGFIAWHVATHYWFATMCAMAGVLALTTGRDRARLATSGALCGLSAWFTQSLGGAALVGLVMFLLWEGRERKRNWRLVLGGICVLGAAFAATLALSSTYFAWEAGLGQFINLTVVFPLKYFQGEREINTYRVYLRDLGRWQWWEVWPQAFYEIGVPLVYIYFFLIWRDHHRDLADHERECIMLIALPGAALLASVVAAPSALRLTMVSPPALVLLGWLVNSAPRARKALFNLLWFAVLLSGATVIFTTARREERVLAYLELPTGRAAFLDRPWFQECTWLRDRTSPGDYFFAGRTPYYYFPLELEPPTEVLFVTTSDYTQPAQVSKLVEALESQRVRFLAWQTVLDRPPFYDAEQDHLGPLRDYVRAHYTATVTYSVLQHQFLERR